MLTPKEQETAFKRSALIRDFQCLAPHERFDCIHPPFSMRKAEIGVRADWRENEHLANAQMLVRRNISYPLIRTVSVEVQAVACPFAA